MCERRPVSPCRLSPVFPAETSSSHNHRSCTDCCRSVSVFPACLMYIMAYYTSTRFSETWNLEWHDKFVECWRYGAHIEIQAGIWKARVKENLTQLFFRGNVDFFLTLDRHRMCGVTINLCVSDDSFDGLVLVHFF